LRTFLFSTLVALAVVAGPGGLEAQPKARVAPNQQLPDILEPAEAEAFREKLQHARPARTQVFDFVIEYRPYREESEFYEGRLAVGSDPEGRYTRLDLAARDDAVSLFVSSGENPRILRQKGDARQSVEDLESVWTRSILPPLPVYFADLGMPYLDQDNWRYLGPERRLGRPCQVFLVPSSQRESIAYRMTIDEDFLAILQVETFDRKKEELVSSWEISRLKKVDETWIVRQINYRNPEKREKAIFTVTDWMAVPPESEGDLNWTQLDRGLLEKVALEPAPID